MEEQENSMIDVTVKTLDSQSRSYTVRAQVSLPQLPSLPLVYYIIR